MDGSDGVTVRIGSTDIEFVVQKVHRQILMHKVWIAERLLGIY